VTLHYHGGVGIVGYRYMPDQMLSAEYRKQETRAIERLRGRCFCVSHAHASPVELAHKYGQSVMLDNGAFSKWKSNRATDWSGFYAWCDKWISCPTTWAVVPDVIDGSEAEQDALLRQWPFERNRAAPVWHMNESLGRLVHLISQDWFCVCIGSTSRYKDVMSDLWQRRMDEIWDGIAMSYKRTPRVHMLRGMAVLDQRWPFFSVDSTALAKQHFRDKIQLDVAALADRLDGKQCPMTWTVEPQRQRLLVIEEREIA
jgi:hypothetical protein